MDKDRAVTKISKIGLNFNDSVFGVYERRLSCLDKTSDKLSSLKAVNTTDGALRGRGCVMDMKFSQSFVVGILKELNIFKLF